MRHLGYSTCARGLVPGLSLLAMDSVRSAFFSGLPLLLLLFGMPTRFVAFAVPSLLLPEFLFGFEIGLSAFSTEFPELDDSCAPGESSLPESPLRFLLKFANTPRRPFLVFLSVSFVLFRKKFLLAEFTPAVTLLGGIGVVKDLDLTPDESTIPLS